MEGPSGVKMDHWFRGRRLKLPLCVMSTPLSNSTHPLPPRLQNAVKTEAPGVRVSQSAGGMGGGAVGGTTSYPSDQDQR